ncbi:BA14K family protein [Bartonella koehlerae]|uniref:Lectin-like protein BA14k n=1 Tax=Bartonella koehlerae C-29 TaxID=1134510 RepID=A0A067WFG7_9HYPH|nr:BA14K family protein [Bartonella koehlerae]KEC54657.1 hypothetical protein O9A_01271 [Bartonella koehlerae C-29]
MKKITKLAVLSAISTATISVPLGTTLADTKLTYSEEITKKIEDMRKETKTNFPSHNFSARSILEKNHPYYPSGSHRHVDHKRREQSHYHTERKTHRHVERKITTHRNVYERHVTRNNSGDALASGIIGFAAGTILGNVLKKPEQPEVIYQTVPQNQIVYQEVPQNQVIYEVQSTTYQPVQQPRTADWLQYCKKKYRSFNPKTGTFRGYDGLEHFCYAPLN